jgi:hypothetical protein
MLLKLLQQAQEAVVAHVPTGAAAAASTAQVPTGRIQQQLLQQNSSGSGPALLATMQAACSAPQKQAQP